MNTISKLIGCPVGGVIRVAFQHPSWGDGLRPAEKLFVKSIFRREILVCQLTTICSVSRGNFLFLFGLYYIPILVSLVHFVWAQNARIFDWFCPQNGTAVLAARFHWVRGSRNKRSETLQTQIYPTEVRIRYMRYARIFDK